MQIEIDLTNKAEAVKQIKKVQMTIDDLINVCEDQKQMLIKNNETISDSITHINELNKTNNDLVEVIKSMYLILNSKKDKFKDDKEMETLLKSMAVFVLNAGASLNGFN